MRRVVNSTYVSLDGVIEHLEGWHFDYFDDEAGQYAWELLSASDALLMGRLTYEALRRGLVVAVRGVRRQDQQHAEVRRLDHARGGRLGWLDPDPGGPRGGSGCILYWPESASRATCCSGRATPRS